MKLFADSGSTKTEWILCDDNNVHLKHFETLGLNPIHLNDESLRSLLEDVALKHLNEEVNQIVQILFYGSGCTPVQRPRVAKVFESLYPAARVQVESDLLGACRALCNRNEGICCILGTGSASCLYDGDTIIQQTPSLGYILGDEGSGASLGKHLLSDILKGQLPDSICRSFREEYVIDVASVIENVYRRPNANRYLASFCKFLSKNIRVEEIENLVISELQSFIRRNLKIYSRPDLPINFVGSIAYYFSDQLKKALAQEQMLLGKVIQKPLDGILSYHSA